MSADRRSVIKNFLFVAAAKIFSLGSLFICNIFVARISEPVFFGYYSIALSLVILFDAMIGAPLDNAMVRFSCIHNEDVDRISRVQGFLFRFKLTFGFIVLTLVFLFIDNLTPLIFGNKDAPGNLLIIASISGVAVLMVRSSATYLQINHFFSDYANLDSLQGSLRLFLVLSFYFYGVTQISTYLVIYGLSSFLAFLVFFFLRPQKYIFSSWPDKDDLKRILSYIGVTSTIVILGTITGRADVVLLSMFGDSEQTGYYSVAVQLAFAGTLLASYLAIIFQPRVIQMARNNTLSALINKNMWMGLMVTILAIPVAISLVPFMVPLIFGDNYLQSIPILQILIFGICADFMILPVLMPYAIQVIPGQIVFGELALLIVFLAGVIIFRGFDPIAMAYFVSIIRILKLFLYFFSVTLHLRAAEKNNYSI